MNLEKSSIENDRIEKLKKALYSRNFDGVSKDEKSSLEKKTTDVPTSWGVQKNFEYNEGVVNQKRNNSFFNKFFLISTVIFLISLSAALYIFYGGINFISSNNLDVRIIAPSSVSSGEELPIGLTIINGNRTGLEDVYLIVDYPQGSQAINSDKVLIHDRISLGTIENGGNTQYSLRSVLFGEKDELKDFNFKIEYKVKGSNATFTKEKKYSVTIGTSPVLMNILYPKEINSGQEVKIIINLTSNSAISLKNTLVKVDYPYGFSYKNSNIKPLRDNSIWDIGSLQNGEKKTLELTGVLIGQNQEDKTFKVTTGTKSSDSTKDFEAELVNQDITVGIRKSFFDLSISKSGNSKARLGDVVGTSIKWKNTLPDKILNVNIVATVSGNALDKSKVSVDKSGYYKSLDNTITWDKNNYSNLAQLLPGEGGEVNISVGSPSNLYQLTKIKNPHIDIHLKISGDRASQEGGTVVSEADLIIKLVSNLTFVGNSYRNVGPFSNSGPFPPKVDNETTYTITWALNNTVNDLSEAVVSAKLPNGVIWKGEISPATEKIVYNADDRMLTWYPGNVSSGTGFVNSSRTISFKIGFIPSINQVQTRPILFNNINISAKDTYADQVIEIIGNEISTQVSDPGLSNTAYTVIP